MSRSYAPEGQQCVAPYLLVSDADREVEFLQSAFGAELVTRMVGGEGGSHMEVRIDDTVVMIGQPPAEMPAQPAYLHVYVSDVNGTYRRAIDAGATPQEEPQAQSYGDQRASFIDPAGHRWWIATAGPREG